MKKRVIISMMMFLFIMSMGNVVTASDHEVVTDNLITFYVPYDQADHTSRNVNMSGYIHQYGGYRKNYELSYEITSNEGANRWEVVVTGISKNQLPVMFVINTGENVYTYNMLETAVGTTLKLENNTSNSGVISVKEKGESVDYTKRLTLYAKDYLGRPYEIADINSGARVPKGDYNVSYTGGYGSGTGKLISQYFEDVKVTENGDNVLVLDTGALTKISISPSAELGDIDYYRLRMSLQKEDYGTHSIYLRFSTDELDGIYVDSLEYREVILNVQGQSIGSLDYELNDSAINGAEKSYSIGTNYVAKLTNDTMQVGEMTTAREFIEIQDEYQNEISGYSNVITEFVFTSKNNTVVKVPVGTTYDEFLLPNEATTYDVEVKSGIDVISNKLKNDVELTLIDLELSGKVQLNLSALDEEIRAWDVNVAGRRKADGKYESTWEFDVDPYTSVSNVESNGLIDSNVFVNNLDFATYESFLITIKSGDAIYSKSFTATNTVLSMSKSDLTEVYTLKDSNQHDAIEYSYSFYIKTADDVPAILVGDFNEYDIDPTDKKIYLSPNDYIICVHGMDKNRRRSEYIFVEDSNLGHNIDISSENIIKLNLKLPTNQIYDRGYFFGYSSDVNSYYAADLYDNFRANEVFVSDGLKQLQFTFASGDYNYSYSLTKDTPFNESDNITLGAQLSYRLHAPVWEAGQYQYMGNLFEIVDEYDNLVDIRNNDDPGYKITWKQGSTVVSEDLYKAKYNRIKTPSLPGIYNVEISVDAGALGKIEIDTVLNIGGTAIPVVLDSLEIDVADSTSTVGEEVTMSATVLGGVNPMFKFWVKEPGKNWVVVEDYSPKKSYTFTPTIEGTYEVGVWVVDDLVTSHQVITMDLIVEAAAEPLNLVSLTTDKAGNTSTVGEVVIATANVTGGSDTRYKYWLKKPNASWVVVQEYSDQNNYIFRPVISGAYQIGVWAIDDNNKTHQVKIIDYTVKALAEPLVLTALSTNHASNTSEVGEAITATANVTGGSNAKYQYWLMEPGKAWKVVKAYSLEKSYSFTPSISGAYQIGVWAIDDNNKSKQVKIIEYNVQAKVKPVVLNSLTTNHGGNVSDVGESIVATSNVTGGSNVRYQYWLMEPGKTWKVVQSYSEQKDYTFTPSVAGTYQIGVWVKDDQSTSHQLKVITYEVDEAVLPLTLDELSTNHTSNSSGIGEEVIVTAEVTGGRNVRYQYWLMKPGASWQIVSKYSERDEFSFTPVEAGKYQIGVWVIDSQTTKHQVETIEYTVSKAVEPLEIENLLSNHKGNNCVEGESVTVTTDISGGISPRYKYWLMKPGGKWQVVREYASDEEFTFVPTKVGEYQIGVWVVDSSVKTTEVEIISFTVEEKSEPLEIVELTTDHANNRSFIDQKVNVTTEVIGGRNVRYKYWLMKPGEAWKVVRDYEVGKDYTFTPTKAGTYQIGVWALGDGSSTHEVKTISYVVEEQDKPVSVKGISTGLVGDTCVVGTDVTASVSTSGGSGMKYLYWLMAPGKGWTQIGSYTSANSFTFTAGTAGEYQIGVWVIGDNTKDKIIEITSLTVTN